MNLPDLDEPFDVDSLSVKMWARVPEPVRQKVELHVAAHLPAEMLARVRGLYARGINISSDPEFFHFGAGMVVRNLCRERLSDDELVIYCPFGGDWDHCYLGSAYRHCCDVPKR
ncbi:hypothetical protein ABIF61_001675 [Bradyrhizobium japonicum]|uniref:hypothetical protein n=1 Tax=Bradyrhizobium ottawaense TaxID=931866 RepID=UPI00347E4F93